MSWREQLNVGELTVSTITQTGANTTTGLNTSTKNILTATAVTATSDGLTTGLITLGSSFVVVTSASANNIATLPAGTAGQVINFWVGANGCEIRTPAASGATINNVDSDGTNEAAIPATTAGIAMCVATDTWIVRLFTELGADIAALVPDTA